MEDLSRPLARASEDFEEYQLIELARVQPAAFARLYEMYVDRVFSYLRTYTETQEDAADLTQHVFLRALESLPAYRDRGLPFGAWLFRIARNAATDTFRRSRRALPWEHVPESLRPISSADPEAASIHRESLNHMRVIVGGLEPQKQELLALRFAGGLSSTEIAALLGRSPAAVQKELVRIMRHLKEEARELSI